MRTAHRVGIVVAVLLVAHLWMLQASGHQAGHDAEPHVAVAPTELPATGGCPAGMAACLASAPDDAATLAMAAALVVLVGALAPRRLRRSPLVHRVSRDHRHPPRPCVPSSVVLLQ